MVENILGICWWSLIREASVLSAAVAVPAMRSRRAYRYKSTDYIHVPGPVTAAATGRLEGWSYWHSVSISSHDEQG